MISFDWGCWVGWGCKYAKLKISFLVLLAAVPILFALFTSLALRLLFLLVRPLTVQFHRFVHQVLREDDAIDVLPDPRGNRLHLQIQQREMLHCALEVVPTQLEPCFFLLSVLEPLDLRLLTHGLVLVLYDPPHLDLFLMEDGERRKCYFGQAEG